MVGSGELQSVQNILRFGRIVVQWQCYHRSVPRKPPRQVDDTRDPAGRVLEGQHARQGPHDADQPDSENNGQPSVTGAAQADKANDENHRRDGKSEGDNQSQEEHQMNNFAKLVAEVTILRKHVPHQKVGRQRLTRNCSAPGSNLTECDGEEHDN